MTAGRPPKYHEGLDALAYNYCLLGATDEELAEFFDVEGRTIYRWKNDHPSFCQALKAGKKEADAKVSQSLFHRATGYEHEAVKIAVNAQGEITQVPFVERYPPDTTAMIFWLKNRRPDKWRDVNRQEHSGPDGAAIPTSLAIAFIKPAD